MENLKKFQKIFTETLDVKKEALEELTYQSVDGWDSVGHMALIAALEDEYDIMLDTDDIIDFSSYKKGLEILGKYGIEF